MKKILWVFGGVLVLFLVFTFLPTGMSRDEVIDSYLSTQDYAQSVQSSLAYQYQQSLVQQAANTVGVAGERTNGDLADVICQVAIYLAETYGCGHEGARHPSTQLKYSLNDSNKCNVCGYNGYDDYSTYNKNMATLREIVADSSVHGHISCAAFASFVWGLVWEEAQGKFSASTSTLRDLNWGSATFESINESDWWEHCKPGDIISRSKSNGSGHTMIYIGNYTAPDGITIEHAIAHASIPRDNRDVLISPMSWDSSCSNYVIHLDDCVKVAGGVTISDDYKLLLPDVEVLTGGVFGG